MDSPSIPAASPAAGQGPESLGPESISQKSVRERIEAVIKEGSHAKVIMTLRELKRTLEEKEVYASLSRGITNYVYAVGALAFACREINISDVERLVISVGIEPSPRLLETIKAMHYRNYGIYLNIIYFMVAMGIEPTIQGVVRMLRAMDFGPDPTLAGFAIEYFKEFSSGKVSYEIPEPEGEVTIVFNKMASLTFSLSRTITDYVLKELGALLLDERMRKYPDEKILHYIGAVGLLAYSGRDVDRNSISRIVESMGLTPEEEILDDISGMQMRNHIIYIIAVHFIRAVGLEPGLDKLIGVVEAMDVSPDLLVAGNVVSFYKMEGPQAF